MVAAGGAAAEQQLDERQLGADADILRTQFGPDRIERLEPVEQDGVLCGGDDARQRLVEMVVGVDKARQDDLAAGVDAPVGGVGQLRRQLPGQTDPGNDMIVDDDGGVAEFAAGIVHRHKGVGVLDQGCRHAVALW